MSSIFDDGFSMQDAALIGGIMGFAEESIREENVREIEEITEEVLADPRIGNEVNLAAFQKSNPELFRRIVLTIVAQKKKWSQEAKDFEEVEAELRAMAKTEALLGESE